MPFIHNPIDLKPLERETINGVRYYKVPDSGELIKMPSITTITSHYKKDFFVKWRERVGAEKADKITKRATSRGTEMHLLTEHYLNNEEVPKAKIPISGMLFNVAKPGLDRIDNIIAQEKALYSLRLGVAGTVDCIADFDGELSIIDFKTSKAPKPREWIEGYFVQAAAYSCMLYELTGLKAKKLVIIMACEDGDLEIYEEKDIFPFIQKLGLYIRKFVTDKLEEL